LDDFWWLIRGIAIGLAVAIPVGPIALLCMRRTLERGFLVGFATGFGAAEVAFGATGLAGFSANWLKQISLSFSSFEKRQSVTTLAGSGIGLGCSCGGRIAS